LSGEKGCRLNWVDVFVIAVIIVSGLLAFLRGFVREALAVAAWIGALFAAWSLFPTLQPQFRSWIGHPELAGPAAFLVVFVVVLVVLSVVAGLVGGVVRASVMGGVDRTLGTLFGMLRGAVLVIAAYIGLGMLASPDRWPDALTQARTVPYAYAGAVWVAGLLPSDYRPVVRPPPAGPATNAENLLQPQPSGHAIGKP